jgi:hypothetical protein
MLLYILFMIVLLFLWLNNSNVEGFKEDTKIENKQQNKNFENNKKCLIVYYGGSFREGNIGSTLSDTKYGYEAQKHASITHAKLKKVLNEKGYQTDILVNTRDTVYKEDLMNWYNPFNIILNNLPKELHAKDLMIQNCINNINKLNKEEYKFILFIRIDLFLKPEFYKILDTESNKIMFLANNFDPKLCINYTKKNNPKIVDLIMYIPKKYYYILDSNFILNHDSWDNLKKKYKLSHNDISFMSNKMFDSNSMIDHNPYYLMSSRKENVNNHTNEVFNINNSIQKCNIYNELRQKYMSNPTQHYINKYNNFYMN